MKEEREMKKLLLVILVILLVMIPIAGCSNRGSSTAPILNANFEVVDNGDTILIKDKSESDFNEIQYIWTLCFYNENREGIFQKSFTEKEFSFPKPNVKSATLELSLLVDGKEEINISERKKNIPTNYIKIITVKEENLLRIYFAGKANKWQMLDESGNVLKEKTFDHKVEDVLFDIERLNLNRVILKVFNDEWLLNQTHYEFDDNNNQENNPPVLNPIGDKTVEVNTKLEFTINASDPDGDNLSYEAHNLPESATFSNKTFIWAPATLGEYEVNFSVSDGNLEDSETITIYVEEEPQQEEKLTASFDGRFITIYTEKEAEFIHWEIEGTILGYETDSTNHKAEINIEEFDNLGPGTYDCSIQAYNCIDNEMVPLYNSPTIIEVTK